MWECSYAKEPFDCRLMVLRLLQKIWIPLLAAVLGAVAAGGGYYLWKEVITGQQQYTQTTQYEVIYGTDPDVGREYTYINDVTWNEWVTTDLFLALVEQELGETALSREQLEQYLAAKLPSDIRMPSTIVTTPEKELTQQLTEAVQRAMVAFGEEKLEIERIQVADTDEPVLVKHATRTPQAGILGAVLSTLFVILVMFLRYGMEEAVWLPETISYRFGLLVAGAVGYGEETLHATERQNLLYLFRNCGQVGVIGANPKLDLKAAAAMLPEAEGREYVCISSPEQMPEVAQQLREMDGILLLLEAGAGNGRRIVQLLEYLRVQDCKVTAALLWNADRKLLQAYYFSESLTDCWRKLSNKGSRD